MEDTADRMFILPSLYFPILQGPAARGSPEVIFTGKKLTPRIAGAKVPDCVGTIPLDGTGMGFA